MSAENRKRTVDELRILYRTHPKLRDVLVEGPSDARFFRWFLQEMGSNESVQVYEVDKRVIAPAEAVQAVHPEVNKRGRVVYVASEADRWGEERSGLTCIIDADFDVFRGDPAFEVLLTTDFPALEGYALQTRPFTKFLSQFVEGAARTEDVLAQLLPSWRHLFALRYVLHVHSDGKSLVKGFAERCVKKGATLEFDAHKLIQSSISAKLEEVERLKALYEDRLAHSPAPSLATVRGHDIAPLLIRFLDLSGDLKVVASVENLLRACIELVDVMDMPMFKRLQRRVLVPAV